MESKANIPQLLLGKIRKNVTNLKKLTEKIVQSSTVRSTNVAHRNLHNKFIKNASELADQTDNEFYGSDTGKGNVLDLYH